jgi:uncharacterized protein involved in cysteine biosynthesis
VRVLGDIAWAVDALRDPRFWRVALKAVGFTLALLVALFWLVGWLVGVGGDWSLALPWVGTVAVDGGWGLGLWILAAVVLSGFLMLPVSAVFVGFMLDEVVEAVERRRYPHLPPARGAPLSQQAKAALSLFLALVVANALALIVYIVAAPLAPLVFALVNGWLIGREYLETVAMRRMPLAEATAFRKRNATPATLLGAAVAIVLPIPLLNLFAPLLGAAAATHMFHRLRAREA